MYLDNGASRLTFPAWASSRTSAAVNVLVMLSIGIIDFTCTRAPMPSVPAAPAHDPWSVTTAAASPRAPAVGDAACSTSAWSSTACSFLCVGRARARATGDGKVAYGVLTVVAGGGPLILAASPAVLVHAASSRAATTSALPGANECRIVTAASQWSSR